MTGIELLGMSVFYAAGLALVAIAAAGGLDEDGGWE